MEANFLNSDAVVVVGGGFAGLMTALSLSSKKNSPPIILLDPRPSFVFTPLLYELLSDELQSWEVTPTFKSLLAGNGISFIQESVVKVNIDNSCVISSSGQIIQYSQLVIATGAKPETYGVPGVSKYAFSFNQLDDVAKLRNLIDQLNTKSSFDEVFAIVGAGPSGIELACKVSDLLNDQIEIHLIELGDCVLPNGKSFNQEQSLRALKKRGIKIHLQTRVRQVNEDSLELINSSDKNRDISYLSYRALVWLAGSKPNTPLLGLPKSSLHCDALSINSTLQVIGLRNVFAIGDVAIDLSNPINSTAQVAMQQAKFLSKNLIATRNSEPLDNFSFIDRGEMLSLGIGEATITGMGLTLSGPLAFELRRLTYLSNMPSISLGIRSAGAWLLEHGKNFI